METPQIRVNREVLGGSLAEQHAENMRDPVFARVYDIVNREEAVRRRLAEMLAEADLSLEELANRTYSNKGYLKGILTEPFYRTAKSLTFLKYALLADALGYEADIVFRKKES
ncbi:MAG: hypothetical protein Q8P36_02095 [bacterium]|nr:hypothetical protein [bacterium]